MDRESFNKCDTSLHVSTSWKQRHSRASRSRNMTKATLANNLMVCRHCFPHTHAHTCSSICSLNTTTQSSLISQSQVLPVCDVNIQREGSSLRVLSVVFTYSSVQRESESEDCDYTQTHTHTVSVPSVQLSH